MSHESGRFLLPKSEVMNARKLERTDKSIAYLNLGLVMHSLGMLDEMKYYRSYLEDGTTQKTLTVPLALGPLDRRSVFVAVNQENGVDVFGKERELKMSAYVIKFAAQRAVTSPVHVSRRLMTDSSWPAVKGPFIKDHGDTVGITHFNPDQAFSVSASGFSAFDLHELRRQRNMADDLKGIMLPIAHVDHVEEKQIVITDEMSIQLQHQL